jgi:hypothetical protein
MIRREPAAPKPDIDATGSALGSFCGDIFVSGLVVLEAMRSIVRETRRKGDAPHHEG